MKVEAKLLLRDNCTTLLAIYHDGAICASLNNQAELREVLPYLQHAANCPPDRVRFVPDPMVWENPTPWVWYSGDYTIVASPNGRCSMRHRDYPFAMYSTVPIAQADAERHREGK